MDKKQRNSRIDIAAWTAIAVGLILGFLLKRVRFGFIFGLSLGIIIVYLMKRRSR